MTYIIHLVNSLLKSISNNYRFYAIKILLDLISESHVFYKNYSKLKNSDITLMFMCASTVSEMLTDTNIAPNSYRSFLSKFSNYSRDTNAIIDTNINFCRQVHKGSMCSSKLIDCIKCNITIFFKNFEELLSLYFKLYAIPLVYIILKNSRKELFINKINNILVNYIKNTVRSTLSLSSFYFVIHNYLALIDQLVPPKKIHFHFGLLFGSLCLILGETPARKGMITQFMFTIYLNMFFHETLPGKEVFWKKIFQSLLLVSLIRRGIVKSIMSIF